MEVRAHVFISGRVQGVYYRSYAADEARNLGLSGWVRNIRGGRVEAILEGEEDEVKRMIAWCWEGSPSSRVTSVEVEWEEPTHEYGDFSVTYGY